MGRSAPPLRSADPRRHRPPGTGSGSRRPAHWRRCPRCGRHRGRSVRPLCPARSLRLGVKSAVEAGSGRAPPPAPAGPAPPKARISRCEPRGGKVLQAVGTPLLYLTPPSLPFRPRRCPGPRPLLFLCPVKPLVAQWCLTLCDPSLPGSSVHGISQARILEWLTIPFSRGSSPPRSPALQANCLPSEPPRGWPSQDLYFFEALVSLSARSYRFWTNRAQLAPGWLKSDAQCSLAL